MWLKSYPSHPVQAINLAQALEIAIAVDAGTYVVVVRYNFRDINESFDMRDNDFEIFRTSSEKAAVYAIELLYRLMAEGRTVCDIEEIKEAVKKKFKE